MTRGIKYTIFKTTKREFTLYCTVYRNKIFTLKIHLSFHNFEVHLLDDRANTLLSIKLHIFIK